MSPDMIEILKPLGAALSTVLVLLMWLRQSEKAAEQAAADRKAERADADRKAEQASAERRELTTQFLTTLQTTVAASTAAQLKQTEALQDLVASTREGNQRTTEEHNRLIDAIGKMSLARHAA